MQINTIQEDFCEIALANDNGISTGFEDLDDRFGGFKKGKLYLLGGRPQMGKTTLTIDMTLNALAQGKKVVIFSLHELATHYVKRLVDILSKRAELIGISESENEKNIEAAKTWLSCRNLTIDDTPGVSIEEISNSGLLDETDLVVIDYYQLLSLSESDCKKSVGELKKLAEEKKTAILVISQVYKTCENRKDYRPLLKDFFKGADLYADVVMAMYRDEYYRPDTDKKRITEIGVLQNRDGTRGVVELIWSPDN